MQKILQEVKEKDLGVPEGNFKLYSFFLQVTRGWLREPLKTSSSHRRIFVQPKVLRAVLEMTQGLRRPQSYG